MTTEGFANDGTMLMDFVQFDVNQEMAESERKKPWPMGYYAKSLFKKSDMRILLISMEKGSVLKEHHADGAISVQILKGSVRFAAQGTEHELQIGTVVTLAASIKHHVEALDDSALLVTLSWPDASRLEAMKHRGYGT